MVGLVGGMVGLGGGILGLVCVRKGSGGAGSGIAEMGSGGVA